MDVPLPVYEKVHEYGYEIFNDPGTTFEEFYLANLFKYYKKADEIRKSNDSMAQREALLQLMVQCGLSMTICEYINTKEEENGDTYHLKDPIVLKNWIQNNLKEIEIDTEHTFDDVFTGRRFVLNSNESTIAYTDHHRLLNGLRLVVMSLIQRFYDGNASVREAVGYDDLQQSGLNQLTHMILQIHAIQLKLKLAVWFDQHQIIYDSHAIVDLYKTRRLQHFTNRQQYMRKWSLPDVEKRNIKLLIDYIMESTEYYDVLPPKDSLAHWFQRDIPVLVAEPNILGTYETHFHLQTSLLLYLNLDIALLNETNMPTDPTLWMDAMLDLAENFAQTMDIPRSMYTAMVAFWCIDTSSILSKEKQKVALHQAVDLLASVVDELDVMQRFVAIALLQRIGGEYAVAYELFQVVDLPNVNEWPTSFVQVILSMYLDGDMWEAALTLIRRIESNEHLTTYMTMYFQWFEKAAEVPLLIAQTYTKEEEACLDTLVRKSQSPENIDYLIAYYLERFEIEKAILLEHEYRFILKTNEAVDTQRTQLLTQHMHLLLASDRKRVEEKLKTIPVKTQMAAAVPVLMMEDSSMDIEQEDEEEVAPINPPAAETPSLGLKSPGSFLRRKKYTDSERVIPSDLRSQNLSFTTEPQPKSLFFAEEETKTAVAAAPMSVEEPIELKSPVVTTQRRPVLSSHKTTTPSSPKFTFTRTSSQKKKKASFSAREMKLRTPPASKALVTSGKAKKQEDLILNVSKTPQEKTKDQTTVPDSHHHPHVDLAEKSAREKAFDFANTKTPMRKRIPTSKYATPENASTSTSQMIEGSVSVPVRRNPRRSARKKY